MKKSVQMILVSLFAFAISGKAQLATTDNTLSLNQQPSPVENISGLTKPAPFQKGRFFFYWGYNRSAYTKSDIHFTGSNYNFTIYDVSAGDSPTKDLITYIQPAGFTHPQYNYRLGYYLSNKYSVSIGNDHMKYHLLQQATNLTGYISGGHDAETFDNLQVLVGEDDGTGITGDSYLNTLPRGFVPTYENFSGLNDISIELGRTDKLWVSANKKHALSAMTTIGVGSMVTNTHATVLGINDKSHTAGGGSWNYHMSGFSTTASAGIQFDFCRHFFLLTRLKGGFIDLTNVNTTIEGGKARQHFGFLETMAVIGFTCNLDKR